MFCTLKKTPKGTIASNYQVLSLRPKKKGGYAMYFAVVTFIASKINWGNQWLLKCNDLILKWSQDKLITISTKIPSYTVPICKVVEGNSLIYQPAHEPNDTRTSLFLCLLFCLVSHLYLLQKKDKN